VNRRELNAFIIESNIDQILHNTTSLYNPHWSQSERLSRIQAAAMQDCVANEEYTQSHQNASQFSGDASCAAH
jgi:hypothetical protein